MLQESPPQQLDEFEACFTYSPNWYTEQSIALDAWYQSHLYYASNHLFYLYDMASKRVKWECSAKMLIKDHLERTKQKNIVQDNEFKQMKLFCICPTEMYLVLGLNDGIVVVVTRQLECKFVYRVKIENITHVLAFEQATKLCVVLFDEAGTCVQMVLEDWKVERLQIKIEQEPGRKDRLKKVVALHDDYYCFYQRGLIYRIDKAFEKPARKLTYSKTETIMFVASIDNKIVMLCKEKEGLALCFFQIQQPIEFPLEHTKTIYELTKSVLKCQIEIEYPKKYQYKRDEMKNAALSVEWITPTKFIMTGRLAEVYVFDLNSPPKTGKLLLKPFSIEEDNPCYTTLPESHHYDEVYQVYRRGSSLWSIGTDRNLNFWKITEDAQLRFDYAIKFLASAVRQVIISESEKSVSLYLMNDSIIRSWDMARQENLYMLAEYWKAKQKLKITQICCHPKEEGLLVLLTDDNSIYFYDLYEERQIRMQKMETLEQCTLSFISESIVPQLCAMFESDLQPRKLQTKEFWKRNISTGYLLMVQIANSVLLINPANSEALGCRKYFKEMDNSERVENVTIFDKSLEVFVRSPSKLTLKLRHASATLQYRVPEQLAKRRYSIALVNDELETHLYMSLFEGRDQQVCVLNVSKEGINLVKTVPLPFSYPLESTIFSADACRLLAYSLLSGTLQLWELDYSVLDKEKPIRATSKNIKAHFGNIVSACLFRNHYAISCSHDQNIKVWDLRKCLERRVPKGKKNKKKKSNKKGGSKEKESSGSQEEDMNLQQSKQLETQK